MRNQKDAPEESDLCKKACDKDSIPEEYYLVTGIFSRYFSLIYKKAKYVI
ncbi:hypothetical protein OZ666_16905 [Elizabethkingia sp. HX QKY]|nr:hypothetical protein [Elizabethkingia sp. HX QKY]MDX8573375.1 hypothetical protein [Elizabethkingia sp. HX QKY]